jgi:hypothetical protein
MIIVLNIEVRESSEIPEGSIGLSIIMLGSDSLSPINCVCRASIDGCFLESIDGCFWNTGYGRGKNNVLWFLQ